MKCMYDCGFSIILEVKTVLVFYVTDQQNFIPTKISVSTSNVLNFFFFYQKIKIIYPGRYCSFLLHKSY